MPLAKLKQRLRNRRTKSDSATIVLDDRPVFHSSLAIHGLITGTCRP